MKTWYLKLHRWVALLFAAPLAVVIVTGLVLSVEPGLVDRAIEPGSLTLAKVQTLLDRYDPDGRARALSFRSFDRTLSFGAGFGGGTTVNVDSGEQVAGPSTLARVLGTARRMHETLLLDAGWLVTASTVAMLVLCGLGVLMGWPRIRNNLSGWHKAIAWGTLPLIVLSPLTALLMTWGVNFTPPPQAQGQPPQGILVQNAPPPAQGEGPRGRGLRGQAGAQFPLKDALAKLAEEHDLAALVALRPLGPRLVARVVENGEFRAYAVTRESVMPAPRNWTRLWHEGNFAGVWSSLLNVVTSLAMIGLLGSGVWLWLRRQLRMRVARRVGRPATA